MDDIRSIDHFNLWSFDLNLLVAFDALMRDRNVTKAAARLRLQQPAMSHNLATLRVLFQDELFIRVGRDMAPTARAHALAASVRHVLAQAQGILTSAESFDPLHDERTFRVGFCSEVEVLLMPLLSARLRRTAPAIKVLASPALPDKVFRLLDDGDIDLAVGGYEDGGERHRREILFERFLLCCFNPELIDAQSPIDRKTYLELPHALVSHGEGIEGCLDRALRRLGVELNVATAAPEFLTVLTTVRKGPLLATLPSRIIDEYAPLFGLAASPVPLDLEIRPISMVWPAQTDREPAAAWLRDEVRGILGVTSAKQKGQSSAGFERPSRIRPQ
ncbi:LysR family transcriptional regulator [Roseiarcus fermentans]|nr:LysR family transcriptional regulator [Roseiarcus fermentans]